MWQDEMTIILRAMIGDFGSGEPPNYTYEDSRLQQLILISAQFVQNEIIFDQQYNIDIVGSNITPDPTINDPSGSVRNDSFINLVLMKAGCFIDGVAARLAAQRSVMMRDADKQIDLHFIGSAMADIWKKGWCQNYADARFEYLAGNAGATGMAIIGPFRDYAIAGGYGDGPWTPDGGSPYGGAAIYGSRYTGLPNDGRFR